MLIHDIMEDLEKLLDDPLITSAARLWARVKELKMPFIKRQVDDFWRGQANVEILRGKPISTTEIKIHAFTNKIGCIQIDLMDVSRYSGYNNRTKFLLNCIDVHSRYAWSFPITNKQPTAIVPHLESVIAEVEQQCPKCLITIFADDGSEFKGAVAKMLEKANISIIRTLKKQNQAIVERFNQRLWGILTFSYFSKDNFKFVDKLPQIISGYNASKHGTTKKTPNQVFLNDQTPASVKVIDLNEQVIDPVKVGDKVRVFRSRKQFEKASTSLKFSPEVYTVSGKEHNRYLVENSKGEQLDSAFLPRELSLSKAASVPVNVRQALNKTVRKRIVQKREPAFSDARHTVDDDGNVFVDPRIAQSGKRITRKKPVDATPVKQALSKRLRKKKVIFDL